LLLVRCGSTPPWSRPTSATRPMGCWPGRARGRWLARAASWPVGCVARPCGWWIVRQRGEPISDRLVSVSDPDARPIRKGKFGKPNEFGHVVQVAEVTANTRRGAPGFLRPAASAPGNPGENRLVTQTAAGLDRVGLARREVALDGGLAPGPTQQTLARLAPARRFVAGRAEPGSRRTRRRLARYRTGCEGRISHPKRGDGLRRSRLRVTRDSGSGPAGRSWPTASTPSPSRPPDKTGSAAPATPPGPQPG